MSPKVNLIVAMAANKGIGINCKLPWKLKQEMAYFSRMTKRTDRPDALPPAVIMGRRTWQSIPPAHRPLPSRRNVVISRQARDQLDVPEDVQVYNSLQAAVDSLQDGTDTAWIIGGHSLYKEAMETGLCDRLYVTRILREYQCDTFFPEISSNYSLAHDPDVPDAEQEEDGVRYRFEVYQRLDK